MNPRVEYTSVRNNTLNLIWEYGGSITGNYHVWYICGAIYDTIYGTYMVPYLVPYGTHMVPYLLPFGVPYQISGK